MNDVQIVLLIAAIAAFIPLLQFEIVLQILGYIIAAIIMILMFTSMMCLAAWIFTCLGCNR